MSKPNLLQFGTSIGFYRNKRILDLRTEIGKSIRVKIDFSDLAPMLFQVVMAYAGENQIDGNFTGYSTEDWRSVFLSNNVHVTTAQAAAIVNAFRQTGLFDGDKIRSWMKFNRHLADYEGIVKAKRRAGKMRQKMREQEERAALKNGQVSAPEPAQKPENLPPKSSPQNVSPSKRLWLLKQQLEVATSEEEAKAIKRHIRELTRQINQIKPPVSPAPPVATARQAPPAKKENPELIDKLKRDLRAAAEGDNPVPE